MNLGAPPGCAALISEAQLQDLEAMGWRVHSSTRSSMGIQSWIVRGEEKQLVTVTDAPEPGTPRQIIMAKFGSGPIPLRPGDHAVLVGGPADLMTPPPGEGHLVGFILVIIAMGWIAAAFTAAQFCRLQDREDLNRDRR